MKRYQIHAALHSEVRSGDIWTHERFNTRLVKVKNPHANKCIIISYRFIDSNYERVYNKEGRRNLTEDSIVLDSYYRKLLRLNDSTREADLEISPTCGIISSMIYLFKHPNDSIRISTCLAIGSFILGAIVGLVPMIVEKVCKH